MIERIHTIKGVGLLHDAKGQAQGFKRATFIYADNGRGKSTLASLFRSCSTNNPNLIINRRTINSENEPEVIIQFSEGKKSIFRNGMWDVHHPEIMVFDSEFVEQNVYAGGQVSTDQRKNLLKFALGANAVLAQTEYDKADQETRAIGQNVRSIISQLSTVHPNQTLSEFKKTENIPNVDEQISELNSKIIEANNIKSLQTKAMPKLLHEPIINIDPIIKIIATSIGDIDLAAEQKVKAHLERYNKKGLEKWISDGYDYDESDNCLFCNQPLKGVEIIQSYRTYFNQDYNKLKLNIAQLPSLIETACSQKIIDQLIAQFEITSTAINGWQEHLEISLPIFNKEVVHQALGNISKTLDILKQQKESNPLEKINASQQSKQIEAYWKTVMSSVVSCNTMITDIIYKIEEYKNGLEQVNIESLKQRIKKLELSKIRHRSDIINLLNKLELEQQKESKAKADKQIKKDALNNVMKDTLDNYKKSINELLHSFGAQFSIPDINFDYRGGLRSDYSLEMRGENIALSGGIPDFKTSLSEGDKRTLAFAFFIALMESDSDLANKIIIIDDPMCSFDLNRKQQTRTVLKKLYMKSKQLVILAHDIHFLRSFRDEILRISDSNFINIKSLKLKAVADRYSDFASIDIDQECESTYFRGHRLLEEYVKGEVSNSLEVARTIRPVLEGYLHRRFPNLINPGLVFGKAIQQIKDTSSPNPLIHAHDIIDELQEINSYAGQFHHDTNPSAGSIDIVESELLGFVERSLHVIYSGKV